MMTLTNEEDTTDNESNNNIDNASKISGENTTTTDMTLSQVGSKREKTLWVPKMWNVKYPAHERVGAVAI